jgi:hypothetical protein
MNTALLNRHALTLHKTEAAKSPSGTALSFTRPTGTERDGRETNRVRCKTDSRP